MTAVLCSKGYPGNYKNSCIENINKVGLGNNDFIYHAELEKNDKVYLSEEFKYNIYWE